MQVNKRCQPLKLELRELLWETFWGNVGELVDLFRFWQTMRGNGASTLTDEMNRFEGNYPQWPFHGES